jgi:hypothetical protein
MLLALTPQSTKAADAMDAIGFSAYDAQGNFIGLEGVAQRLKDGLAGMSEEQRNATLKQIFGNDAIRAAAVLYQQGADGISDWTAKVNDQGYAADTAAARLNNLSGDIEQFTGSLETALINAGEGSQNSLRGIVQGATGLVNAFNKAPAPIQSTATSLLAITAATTGGIWVGTRIIQSIANTQSALGTLGGSSTRATAALKGLAAAGAGLAVLTVAFGGLAALQDSIEETLPGVEQLTSRLLALQAGKVSNLGSEFDSLGDSIDRIANRGAAQKVSDIAAKIGSLGAFGDVKGLEEAKNEVGALDDALSGLASSAGPEAARQAFNDLAESQGLSADQTADLIKLLPQYENALQGSANAVNLAGDATDDYAKSTYKAANGTEITAAALKAIKKAYADARKDATETASSFLDISNKADKAKFSLNQWIKQMANQASALEHFTDNVIRAGKRGVDEGLIQELEKLGPVGALRMKQLANATDEQIDRANRAWKRGQHAVDDYVDATVKVPKELGTHLTVESAQALQHVRDVSVALHGLKDKTIYLTTIVRTIHEETQLGPVHSAGGGLINGPGTSRSDSIPARLSNGEYVIQAAAVDHYGTSTFDALNAMRFASGGPVGSSGSAGALDDLAAVLAALLRAQGPAGKTAKDRAANERDILKALRDFTPKLSQGVDGVTAEIDDLRRSLKAAGGHWTDAMRDQADALIEQARQHDIGKAFKKFDVDVSQGADGVRSEVQDLRSAIRDAGGEWTKGLVHQSQKLFETASAYDLAAKALEDSQATLNATLAQQAAYADQVGHVFNDSLFGNGLAGFDRTVGSNTGRSQTFLDVLGQLSGQGLDGALFQQLAASGDLKTAIQLLGTGAAGIAQREQLFAAMQGAQGQLGTFAGNQVFGADVAAQQQVVAANTTALTDLGTRLERQEAKFDRMVKVVEDLPRHVGNQSYQGTKAGAEDGIKGVAGDAGRRLARGGR